MAYDLRHTRAATNSQGNLDRNDFEAADGQTVFNLNFLLTSNSMVFLNNSLIERTLYSGEGTNRLTFNNPLNLYDKVTVIG